MRTGSFGSVAFGVLGIVGAAGVLGATLLWSASSTVATMQPSTVQQTNREAPLSRNDVGAMLVRSGLDARALAAAGVASEQVPMIVAAMRSYVSENLTQIRATNASIKAKTSEHAQLTRKVQGGVGSTTDAQTLATRDNELKQLRVDRNTMELAALNAAAASLSASTRSTLTNIRANRDSDLPFEYRATQLNGEQRQQLRAELASARGSSSLNASSFRNFQSNDVTAVQSNLSGLNAVQSSWRLALTSQP